MQWQFVINPTLAACILPDLEVIPLLHIHMYIYIYMHVYMPICYGKSMQVMHIHGRGADQLLDST